MDGYLQTGIGIAVSILLFWLSYRQTIGAKKERTKNANKSLHRAVMRRMVLEDYTPKFKDISRVLEGKAREFNTSMNDMLSEEQVLNSIFTEVFDSDLISPSQRVEIETRLDSLFLNLEKQSGISSMQEFKILNVENKKKRDSIAVLAVSVSMVGASTSVLYSYIKDPAAIISSNLEWVSSGLGVFIVSLTMLSLISIIRKQKDDASSPSRSSSMISAASFEIDVAKAIEKSDYTYKSEPRVGKFRPDFVINTENKSVVIEAKSWGDVVPLSIMKKTLNMLESMSNEDGIDSVILVTKKAVPIKGFNSENNKVKVVSMSEFVTMLKNKQVA